MQMHRKEYTFYNNPIEMKQTKKTPQNQNKNHLLSVAHGKI